MKITTSKEWFASRAASEEGKSIEAGSLHGAGSAAAKIVERKMWVGLTANGFAGRFELPEQHFNDLLTWLAKRSCGQAKQPNAERSNPAPKI